MAEDQGTEQTLQDNLENPQKNETVSQEDGKNQLTEEQQEELAIEEEVKKHVKDDDPEGFQKRINQIVRKMREQEREKKKAEKDSAEKDTILEELRKHNEKLYKAIQKQTNVIETSMEDQKEKTSQDALNKEITGIQQHIAALKQQRIQARSELDWAKDTQLEDQIEALKEQLAQKKAEASRKPEKKSEEKEAREISIIEKWKKSTPWFSPTINGKPNENYNASMKRAAMGLDKELIDSPEWQVVPIEDRLEEVKRQIEADFSWEPKKHGMSKIPSSESGKGLNPPKKDNVIELSEEMKLIAHKTAPHLPPAEAEKRYAEQLKFINGGK